MAGKKNFFFLDSIENYSCEFLKLEMVVYNLASFSLTVKPNKKVRENVFFISKLIQINFAKFLNKSLIVFYFITVLKCQKFDQSLLALGFVLSLVLIQSCRITKGLYEEIYCGCLLSNNLFYHLDAHVFLMESIFLLVKNLIKKKVSGLYVISYLEVIFNRHFTDINSLIIYHLSNIIGKEILVTLHEYLPNEKNYHINTLFLKNKSRVTCKDKIFLIILNGSSIFFKKSLNFLHLMFSILTKIFFFQQENGVLQFKIFSNLIFGKRRCSFFFFKNFIYKVINFYLECTKARFVVNIIFKKLFDFIFVPKYKKTKILKLIKAASFFLNKLSKNAIKCVHNSHNTKPFFDFYFYIKKKNYILTEKPKKIIPRKELNCSWQLILSNFKKNNSKLMKIFLYWPFTVFLKKSSTEKYVILAKFLQHIKLIHSLLLNTWKMHVRSYYLKFSKNIRKILFLSKHILLFFEHYLNYLILDVLSKSWFSFLIKIKIEKNTTLISFFQDHFLNKCIENSFLTDFLVFKSISRIATIAKLFVLFINRTVGNKKICIFLKINPFVQYESKKENFAFKKTFHKLKIFKSNFELEFKKLAKTKFCKNIASVCWDIF